MQSKKRGGRITLRLTEKEECNRECEDKKPQSYIEADSTANLRLAWDRYFNCYKECNIQYPNRNRQQRRGGRRATRRKNRRIYF